MRIVHRVPHGTQAIAHFSRAAAHEFREIGVTECARIAQELAYLGVEGYVLKDEAFNDLSYAIRSVFGGSRFFSPRAMSAFSSSGDGLGRGPLSPREREVAVRIANGMTTKEIAADLGIGVKTVETHRQRIMEKLGFHKAAEIAAYVVKSGLVR